MFVFHNSSKDSMNDILATKYTNYVTEDVDYPILKGFLMHGYMPAPRGTRSSELQATTVKKRVEDETAPRKHFVMKRFQNIPGKFQLPTANSVGSPLPKKGKESTSPTKY